WTVFGTPARTARDTLLDPFRCAPKTGEKPAVIGFPASGELKFARGTSRELKGQLEEELQPRRPGTIAQLSRTACAVTSIASGWRERTFSVSAPQSSQAR